VWSEDHKWDLLEVYVCYRVTAAAAAAQYGVNIGSNGFGYYLEHWTKDSYSIYINNEPITVEGVVYDNVRNPFNVVPFVYIPHLREGAFYGPSHVDDLIGLVKEYNARLSDLGMAIKKTVERKRYVKNLTSDPKPHRMFDGTQVVDLGTGVPGGESPEIQFEDPPNMSEGFIGFPEDIYREMLRQSHMNSVTDGEDEGSQRSSLTLAFRMWPSTSHARPERSMWNEGINRIFYIAMLMLAIKNWKTPSGKSVPKEFSKRVQASPDWMPQIPRDRESQLNEIILRLQSKSMSLETALEQFADIRDIPREVQRIVRWMLFEASLGSIGGQATKPDDTVQNDMPTPSVTTVDQE
jgi:hypothetical protein